MGLKVRRFASAEGIQQNVRAGLRHIPEKHFRRPFQQWQDSENTGGYVQKSNISRVSSMVCLTILFTEYDS
jgi:hypothetical protein